MANKLFPKNLPFEEMIAFFRKKIDMPTETYKDLTSQLHQQFFSVAGAMKLDLLAELREAVDELISAGATISDFRAKFKEIVEKHGWAHTGTVKSRSRVIYDTNIRQAYHAGREFQMSNPELRKLRPYGLYVHGGSKSPRPQHLAWHNKVLPLDDPWWETHTPMNDYGCSCKKFMLSERDVKKRGLAITNGDAMPFAGQTHSEKDVNGKVHQLPAGVGFGFESRPKVNPQSARDAVIEKKSKYPPDLFVSFEKENP
jgi:uncharacterized protein with gpF-like domain